MKKSNDFDSMNPDDFEKQLSRRPVRPLPGKWRAEILDAARSAAAKSHAAKSDSRDPFLVNLWRELFWSCRRVWTGLAVIWLAVVIVNKSIDDSPRVTIANAPEQSRDWKMALQAQRQRLRELLEWNEPPAPPATPPRRSDRRGEVFTG